MLCSTTIIAVLCFSFTSLIFEKTSLTIFDGNVERLGDLSQGFKR